MTSRIRRPTKRFEESTEGGLASLSKSVGWQILHSEIEESQAAEQAKKQKAIASKRGNATQPGPLPLPPKHHKPDDDSPLIDCQYSDLTSKEDQIEWLLQVIEHSGDPTNYRDNPEFQDPAVLWEVYEDLCNGGHANDPPPLSTAKVGNEIHVGMTKALEYGTSGQKAGPKLVRMDHTTIGLDGRPVKTLNRQEIGWAVAPKLTRTDHTTLGLDGTPPLPPQTNVGNRHLTVHSPTPSPVRSTPIQKKRAMVSRARVEAIRQESNTRGKETQGHASGPGTGVHGPRNSPKATPSTKSRMARAAPSEVEEGENTEDMDEGGVHPPGVGGHQATSTPPTEGDDEGEDKGENGGDNEPGNSKAQWQSASFGLAAPVVERVVQKLRVEMADVCGFLEFVKSVEDPRCTYFGLWMPKLWAKANDEVRPNQPHFDLQDCHVRYAVSPDSDHGQEVCRAHDRTCYGLDHSEPDHVQESRQLTWDEKWLLPTLTNDESMFQHKIISNTIAHAFFRSTKGIGVKHLAQFTPLIPAATIAYVCAIIRHLIKSYKFNNPKAANLKANEDANSYRMYMRMMQEVMQVNPGALTNIQSKITLRC
ncbi:hypothetical protein FRC06_002231, partial [Ceratobasidium sp. 370]